MKAKSDSAWAQYTYFLNKAVTQSVYLSAQVMQRLLWASHSEQKTHFNFRWMSYSFTIQL